MKILDCTLRDGGYYTNWDFDTKLVANYSKLMEATSIIEYVEVGYRSPAMEGYLGEYYYCPVYVLKKLKEHMPSKKLVVILNEKDVRPEDVNDLLTPCVPYITMVRIAIDPKNFDRAILLAKKIKALGFEVGFNVMYMSNWKADAKFLESLKHIDSIVDYFYMVDSFGGITPDEAKEIITMVKSHTTIPLGFHGHNNLEMALINTLTAIDEGCTMVDATITGMGRGAGNLRTELLLVYLKSKNRIELDFTLLGNVVADFEMLKASYGWGTNLPYMFSGAYSLPQKQVMEWVGMNRYPISSILNALKNQKADIKDNVVLPIFRKKKTFKTAVILGGGQSIKNHKKALKKLLNENEEMCLVHAGTRYVSEFLKLESDQYYTLVGFESEKLLRQIGDFAKIDHECIFPPFPRKMGTLVPPELEEVSREVERVSFTDLETESPMSIAIQVALDLNVKTILLAGFDGYNTEINKHQFALAQENQKIIDDILNIDSLKVYSITPSNYKNIKIKSVYSLVQ